jgi:hypothetical protein
MVESHDGASKPLAKKNAQREEAEAQRGEAEIDDIRHGNTRV